MYRMGDSVACCVAHLYRNLLDDMEGVHMTISHSVVAKVYVIFSEGWEQREYVERMKPKDVTKGALFMGSCPYDYFEEARLYNIWMAGWNACSDYIYSLPIEEQEALRGTMERSE